MICLPCRLAGTLVGRDEPGYIAELHARCFEPVTCTCQHKVRNALTLLARTRRGNVYAETGGGGASVRSEAPGG
jgi:hypothetical protein